MDPTSAVESDANVTPVTPDSEDNHGSQFLRKRTAGNNLANYNTKVSEERFKSRIKELKIYKDCQGHCNVRLTEDMSLHKWCALVRQSYPKYLRGETTQFLLTADRIKTLEGIGFEFSLDTSDIEIKRNLSFMQQVEDSDSSLDFDSVSLDDPSTPDNADNPRCLSPVTTNDFLTVEDGRVPKTRDSEEKKNEKPSTDGKETKSDVAFKNRVEQLKQYKKTHGHCDVNIVDDRLLHKWCDHVRYSYAKYLKGEQQSIKLTKERVETLKAIGFPFQSDTGKSSQVHRERISLLPPSKVENSNIGKLRTRKDIFAQNLEELQAYTENHGHCNVQQTDDHLLYQWCQKLRSSYPKYYGGGNMPIKLTEEKVEALFSLGFDFTPLNVGRNNRQHHEERRINDEIENVENSRKASKVRIGTERGANANTGNDFEFLESNLDSTLDRTLNDSSIPGNEEHTNNEETEKIVQSRSGGNEIYRAGRGTTVSIANGSGLDSSQVFNDPSTVDNAHNAIAVRSNSAFEKKIQNLKRYKAHNGHCNVRSVEDQSLYVWCYSIRKSYPNFLQGTAMTLNLTAERVKALHDIGFDFVHKCDSFERNVEALKQYRKQHGHFDVRNKEDNTLYCWCKRIRDSYPKYLQGGKTTMKLTVERVEALQEIGFLEQTASKNSDTEPNVATNDTKKTAQKTKKRIAASFTLGRVTLGIEDDSDADSIDEVKVGRAQKRSRKCT